MFEKIINNMTLKLVIVVSRIVSLYFINYRKLKVSYNYKYMTSVVLVRIIRKIHDQEIQTLISLCSITIGTFIDKKTFFS